MESSGPRSLDVNPLEARLAVAIAQGHEPHELLEELVDRLLASCAKLPQLNTDGLVLSRQVSSSSGYLAVGHVWMLPNHLTEPVMIRLSLSARSLTTAAGEVNFGLAPGRPTAPSVSPRKALKLLLAEPDEAQRYIPWAYRFRRDADGWVLADHDKNLRVSDSRGPNR